MQVKKKTYTGVSGLFTITDAELAYRTLIRVVREGFGYNIIDSAPGNREVQYSPVGSVTFENVFLGGYDPGGTTDTPPEKVTIIYK